MTHYVPVELFPSQRAPEFNVDWTVSIMTTERTLVLLLTRISCTASFGSSCDFDHEIICCIGSSESLMRKGERLIVKVRASMSGCDGGSPFGGSDLYDVAFNRIDNEPNKFSKMEANGNALRIASLLSKGRTILPRASN